MLRNILHCTSTFLGCNEITHLRRSEGAGPSLVFQRPDERAVQDDVDAEQKSCRHTTEDAGSLIQCSPSTRAPAQWLKGMSIDVPIPQPNPKLDGVEEGVNSTCRDKMNAIRETSSESATRHPTRRPFPDAETS